MRPRLPIALTLLAIIVTACSGAGPLASPSARVDSIDLAMSTVARDPASDADAANAATAINAFGLDLYRAMAAGSENLVISPASIALALGMARPGAVGDTAAEMDAVLHEVASDEHAAWLNALDQALAARNGTFTDASNKEADVALRIANANFAQSGFPLEQTYLDALAARFGAGLQLVDFAADPEAARVLINDWVAEQTEDRIEELLAEGVLTPLTRLALVNAIYLKAQWHTPFDDERTEDAPFTTADGASVMVPTMATEIRMGYAEGAGWRAVELPYVGGSLAMTIVVPDDLEAFEAELDADLMATIAGSLDEQEVALALPRFSVDTQASLGDLLQALGMPTPFDPDRADFSGISPQGEDLYISAVIHQANIDVDEYGTEAAAATAVIIGVESRGPDPITVNVDRPFMFALRDTLTGSVLFLGRVTDPSTTP
jgi:serpin B